MKINKKYLLIFILFIYFLIVYDLYCNKVHALTINQELFQSNIQTQDANVSASLGQLFKNQGEGQVIYQILVTGKRNINTLDICVNGPNNYSSCSPCQFGTTSGYNDSSVQQVFYSLVCNVDTSNDRYVTGIVLKGYAWEPTYINWGQSIQFTNFQDEKDYSQVLSNVDTNLNSISSATWSTNNYANQIKDSLNSLITNMNSSNSQLISQIQQQQEQQHQDNQEIQKKMDQDIDEKDKEAPNQDEYNTAKEKEESIIDKISDVSPNDINFSQDIQATSKIWELTTKILQTNAKVMGLVISILSVGIIKLIMNR